MDRKTFANLTGAALVALGAKKASAQESERMKRRLAEIRSEL